MRLTRFIPWLALVSATIALVLVGGGPDRGPPESALVTRVVDGDTIAVRFDGRPERVRLIGIDTPESVEPGRPVQCFAKEAAAESRRLLAGRRVRLRFDAERRDRYGRLLAYVYRGGDDLFVNAALVERGYARTLTIPPNVSHAETFAGLAGEARRDGRGLWGACSRIGE